MRPRSAWVHKKYPSRTYYSWYRYTRIKQKGKTARVEREFMLTYEAAGKRGKLKVHNISFESWQAAESLGWKKL